MRRTAALREAEERLRRLPDRPAPGETEAADRAWRVVEAAHSARPAGAVRRSAGLRLALVAAVIAVGLAVVLTPAGAKMGNWIEDRLASDDTPAFAGLPEGAQVLAAGGNETWVVDSDGDVQWVGDFSEAGWSPHGLHVIGVSGRRLAAVTPTGDVRWTLQRPRPLHDPVWSPGDGFRVAYLERRDLRVVTGAGTGDHLVRRGAASVPPAWRPWTPRLDYVLTYARVGGLIETVNVDTGRRLWIRRAGAPLTGLAWTPDGSRLVALSGRGLSVYDRDGERVLMRRLAGGRALALHPSGKRVAVTVARRGGTRLLVVPLATAGRPRQLFSGPGRVQGIAWSPTGRRLLADWRDSDQWLMFGPGGQVRALSGVSDELGAGAGFPRVAGWCCSGG